MERVDREGEGCVSGKTSSRSMELERRIHDARCASLVLEDMLVRRLEGGSDASGYTRLGLSRDEVEALLFGLYHVGDAIRAVQAAFEPGPRPVHDEGQAAA